MEVALAFLAFFTFKSQKPTCAFDLIQLRIRTGKTKENGELSKTGTITNNGG